MKRFVVEINGTVDISKSVTVDAEDEDSAEQMVRDGEIDLLLDNSDIDWTSFEYQVEYVFEEPKPVDPNQLVLFPEARFG